MKAQARRFWNCLNSFLLDSCTNFTLILSWWLEHDFAQCAAVIYGKEFESDAAVRGSDR
jgi:hypothetical protein